MTPGARVAAAIAILDDVEGGLPAEQALTRWARRSRFAGSKDRAAVRDHVFDALRQARMAAHYGQGSSGRARMIGLLHLQGADLARLFDGTGHAPDPLSAEEAAFPAAPTDKAVVWNLPDWLVPLFEEGVAEPAQTAAMLCTRAPVTLRCNLARTTRADLLDRLQADGITAAENPLSPAAVTLTDGARKFRNTSVYAGGLAEPQDASSQAVVEALPRAARALDYCAGGGGKALALAMRPDCAVFAHDQSPQRMKDLPVRAARAGADVTVLSSQALAGAAPFDLVVCDAPCSGSGAWRRAPEGKWRLTPEDLAALNQVQDDILDAAQALVAREGCLAYATCSVLRAENQDRAAAFLTRHPGWRLRAEHSFDVRLEGDGFYLAQFQRHT